MDKKQALQVLELPDRIVTVVHGLLALEPIDSDADVRLLDHCHVVGSITDGESHEGVVAIRDGLLAHQTDNLALLVGRHTRRHNTLAHICQCQELVPIAWSLIAVRK